ncbi:hypothetical protein EVAR_47559_1 [Eumeta japonica]|uniref:Uncharacterized protein n=1 Tax=Eumeta variegata TaxID=151549 RepID=A0A4C1WS13_EUMVA|nr:hypothetical protein EVAR_47559_1 [Eumeta japonica]
MGILFVSSHAPRRYGHSNRCVQRIYRLHLNRRGATEGGVYIVYARGAVKHVGHTDFPHNAANGQRPSAVSHRQLSASRSNRRNRNFHRNIVFSSTASRTMISDGRTPSLKSGPFLVEEEFQRARKPLRGGGRGRPGGRGRNIKILYFDSRIDNITIHDHRARCEAAIKISIFSSEFVWIVAFTRLVQLYVSTRQRGESLYGPPAFRAACTVCVDGISCAV